MEKKHNNNNNNNKGFYSLEHETFMNENCCVSSIFTPSNLAELSCLIFSFPILIGISTRFSIQERPEAGQNTHASFLCPKYYALAYGKYNPFPSNCVTKFMNSP